MVAHILGKHNNCMFVVAKNDTKIFYPDIGSVTFVILIKIFDFCNLKIPNFLNLLLFKSPNFKFLLLLFNLLSFNFAGLKNSEDLKIKR